MYASPVIVEKSIVHLLPFHTLFLFHGSFVPHRVGDHMVLRISLMMNAIHNLSSPFHVLSLSHIGLSLFLLKRAFYMLSRRRLAYEVNMCFILHVLHLLFIIITAVIIITVVITAVSYTHLDVYKRQE